MNALVINCSPVRDGATAEIAGLIAERVSGEFTVKSVCIDDYGMAFCRGCRSCHETADCVLPADGADALMREFAAADIIIAVSPSYWADIPGQFKAFIDRCTPWCNTHEPHRSIPAGKTGYAAALRTGPGQHECERIVQSIMHFFGHLEIADGGHLCLTAVENRADAVNRRAEIEAFCDRTVLQRAF